MSEQHEERSFLHPKDTFGFLSAGRPGMERNVARGELHSEADHQQSFWSWVSETSEVRPVLLLEMKTTMFDFLQLRLYTVSALQL